MHLLCRRESMRISLVRPCKDEPVTDDILTHAKNLEARSSKYLTGKTSQR